MVQADMLAYRAPGEPPQLGLRLVKVYPDLVILRNRRSSVPVSPHHIRVCVGGWERLGTVIQRSSATNKQEFSRILLYVGSGIY